MNNDPFSQPSQDRFSYQESLDGMGGPTSPRGGGRSRVFYFLGALVIFCAVAAFAYFLFISLSGMKDALTQVVVPGEKVLTLSEPGKYTVFHEYQSVVEGKVYSGGQNLSGLFCSVRDLSGEQWIELKLPSASSKYSMGGRAGFSVYDFEVPRPGDYKFACQYPEGQTGPEAVMAIGRGFVKNLVINIFKAIGILFGGLLLGIGIITMTAIKRSRALQPPGPNKSWE